MLFDQEEIEEEVLNHFSHRFKGKCTPVYGTEFSFENKNHSELSEKELEDILEHDEVVNNEREYESAVCSPISMTELDSLLKKLPNEKSSGIDHVPNELIKNCGFTFKQYLLTFYNKIIEEGKVPSALNVGKCCLIWKVRN